MERDATTVQVPASSDAAPSAAAASPGQQLAQQIASGNRDGGSIFSQLTSNPFFTAGFGLAAIGFSARIGQKAFILLTAQLRRRLLVDVEITRHDDSYQWFLQWMANYSRSQLFSADSTQAPRSLTSRILARLTPSIHHLSMQTTRSTLPNGQPFTRFSLIPGPGRHILRYRNAFLLVQRERDSRAFDTQAGRPFETVKLTTLFAHRHIFADLFQEARAHAEQAEEGKTKIFVPMGVRWQEFGSPKRKRPIDSVALAEGVKERIVGDVRDFLDARNWYLDRGIPYRRGYLLHGPPGTGKSSFIEALAGSLDFNIAMLNLSQRGVTDDSLIALLANVPPRTLVLLEDADAAFANRRQKDGDGYNGANVTFSGLLNALDGVASSEGRIVFLTTNHIERMDEALIRPGRVDMTVLLGEATESQVGHMWDRFYAEEDADGMLKREFVKRLEDLGLLGKVSTAALQGLFLFNKGDARGAVAMAEWLLPRHGGVEQAAAASAGK